MPRRPAAKFNAPFLRKARIRGDFRASATYPMNVGFLSGGFELEFTAAVTILVGENGSGKSTLLEALAVCAGYSARGGGRNQIDSREGDVHLLADAMQLSWLPKVTDGFFLRSECFFEFASNIDKLAEDSPGYREIIERPYGGKSLHSQSHGEAFLSLFNNRFTRGGLYILDEPEAALSPQRQLSFLYLISEMTAKGGAQIIMATHSPILMSAIGADVISIEGNSLSRVSYKETAHFKLTRDFINNPDIFLDSISRA